MTKNDILKNLEGQMQECYFNAALAKHYDAEYEAVDNYRRAEIISETAGGLLGEAWRDRITDARTRARQDGVDQYRRLYNR
jgi:hypothetical protein